MFWVIWFPSKPSLFSQLKKHSTARYFSELILSNLVIVTPDVNKNRRVPEMAPLAGGCSVDVATRGWGGTVLCCFAIMHTLIFTSFTSDLNLALCVATGQISTSHCQVAACCPG